MTAAAVKVEVWPTRAPGKPIRWRGECPLCAYAAERAEREAAIRRISEHVVYDHGREVKS